MIVKMQKISLIGLRKQMSEISDTLMELGAVEVNTQDQKLTSSDWASLVLKDGNEEQVAKHDAALFKVSVALEVLNRYGDAKKPLFQTKRVVEHKSFSDALQRREELTQTVEQIYSLSERISALKSDENKVNSLLQSLLPWTSYDVDLDLSATEFCTVTTGVFPAVVNLDELFKELQDKNINCHIGKISSDNDQHYTYIVYKTKDEDEVYSVLKQFAFNKVIFKDLTGTASQNISEGKEKLSSIEKERKEIEAQIKGLYSWKSDLEYLYDDLLIKRDKVKVAERMLRTEKVFYLDGWVPAQNADEVKNGLEKLDCIVEIKEPDENEKVPVLLKNNAFSTPFESITNLYSVPAYNGIDPTPFFSFFYCMFYGMMLSDAGYGIIMAAACFAILKAFRLEGMGKKLITTLMFCGVSTIFWGAMFGGWFGDVVTVVGKTFFNADWVIKPLWFNPINEPTTLLVFSFALGILHLFLGMGLKAYMLIRDGHALDALFDIGFWYIALTGLILMALGSVFTPVMTSVGTYMAIAGAIGLLLTQGRHEKNIIKKFTSGLLSLYNVSSYFSDVLSYSRLLALGLATGVIASVVNIIGTLGGKGFFGIVFFIVVFIGAHLFNLVINALGSFVHSSRLQYVEFFGKFFEGGGKAFAPFKKSTKYIDII